MKLLPFYTSQQGGFTAGTCYLLAEFNCMGFSRSLKGLLRKLASSKCCRQAHRGGDWEPAVYPSL